MIVDASVALKWRLREVDANLADRLFLKPPLLAPAVIWVEIGYALTKFVRRGAAGRSDAWAIWLDLQEADVRIFDDAPLLTPALELSLKLNASFYDCIYLALAIAENDLLVTADERFIRAVRATPDLRVRIASLAEAAA